MEFERGVLVSPAEEVLVLDGEVVTAIRTLADRGAGKKAIARELGVSINTVRRYVRRPSGSARTVAPRRRQPTCGRTHLAS